MAEHAALSIARLVADAERRPADAASTLSGAVVSDFMAVVLALLAVLGALTERPLVGGFAGVVLLLALVARLWARLALEEVHFECTPSYRRVLAGDELTLDIVIENRKPLPLPWLRVSMPLRAGLELLDSNVHAHAFMGGTVVELLTSLGRYDRVTTRLRLRAAARGCYPLGAATLRAGDLFGFYACTRDIPPAAEALIACPRSVRVPELELSSLRPFGDAASGLRLCEDPDRPNGVREYRAGDPVKHMDWKTTARRGEPFVRTHDPSVAHHLVVLLDCDVDRVWRWGAEAQILEACVVLAASVIERALARGCRVGLVANGIPAGFRSRAVVPPGRGPEQWPQLMDALARVQSITLHSLEQYVEAFGARAVPAGASIVHVGGTTRRDALDHLAALAARGHRVQMLALGDEPPQASPQIAVMRLDRSRFAPHAEHGR